MPKQLPAAIVLTVAPLLLALVACSNSEAVNYADGGEAVVSETVHDGRPAVTGIKSYLPLDDAEYPYAGIPRIVIETENHRAIKDRETEIPAKLQIWGEKAPESEVMDLTIRGRGNSSWWSMAKKNYKIEFVNKQELLGMPRNRDWALISNHADKTLMRNYLVYTIAPTLGMSYAPRCHFVELFLNKEYLGVYLVTETIKVGKNRVAIPENNNSYIVEFDGKYQPGEQVFFSSVIQENKPFRIHFPKNAPDSVIGAIQNYIVQFETYLKNDYPSKDSLVESWIDLKEYIIHYWIQELAKNPDASFFTSVYFSWIKGNTIQMGPIWDFDIAFGNYQIQSLNVPEHWKIRTSYWNTYLFKSNTFKDSVSTFWQNNLTSISSLTDSIEIQRGYLKKAAQNNFKRWDVLGNISDWVHAKAYDSYDEAVDSLKFWLSERISWISKNI